MIFFTRLYWFIVNSLKLLSKRLHVRRSTAVVITTAVLCVGVALRASLHPLVIMVRKHTLGILLLIASVLFVYFLFCRAKRKYSLLILVPLLTVWIAFWTWGSVVEEHLRLYSQYQHIDTIELPHMPLTRFERIQPRNSIHSLAHEVMIDSETPSEPDFVRVNNQYSWTMAIEPAFPISKTIGGIQEILQVSGTSPAPNFHRKARRPVSFSTGEELNFGRNSRVATVKTFGLWRFLNYEPADVIHIPGPRGEWVQVVSLIRWDGLIFPTPQFGGVQIIEQQHDNFTLSLQRGILGLGTWIPASEIHKHAFLKGQNILPPVVSRHMANSFRFREGFLSPMPGYHVGDIRIPDVKEDANQQPFTSYFTFDNQSLSGLYHYFALEPFDPGKQGLTTSLLISADGIGPVYLYDHYKNGNALTGVSAIATKVMESKKNFDWKRNRPVEHRPYIHQINGKRRFFWLTTVVTHKDEAGKFIAGNVPDVVLTDASYSTPVWVDPLEPEIWNKTIQQKLGSLWED